MRASSLSAERVKISVSCALPLVASIAVNALSASARECAAWYSSPKAAAICSNESPWAAAMSPGAASLQ